MKKKEGTVILKAKNNSYLFIKIKMIKIKKYTTILNLFIKIDFCLIKYMK